MNKILLIGMTFLFLACASSPSTDSASQPAAPAASQPASTSTTTSTTASNAMDCMKECQQKNMARAVAAQIIEDDCRRSCA